MKNIRRMLKRKNGEGYIDVAITILLVSFVLVFTINIVSAVAMKQNLKTAADQIAEYASMNGTTAINDYVAEQRQKTGINFTCSFSGSETMVASGKVQLGDKIICTLTVNTSLTGFDSFKRYFVMRTTSTGLSQVYWK